MQHLKTLTNRCLFIHESRSKQLDDIDIDTAIDEKYLLVSKKRLNTQGTIMINSELLQQVQKESTWALQALDETREYIDSGEYASASDSLQELMEGDHRLSCGYCRDRIDDVIEVIDQAGVACALDQHDCDTLIDDARGRIDYIYRHTIPVAQGIKESASDDGDFWTYALLFAVGVGALHFMSRK